MSSASTGGVIRAATRATVALWIAGYLAWQASNGTEPMLVPSPESLARILPRVEPPQPEAVADQREESPPADPPAAEPDVAEPDEAEVSEASDEPQAPEPTHVGRAELAEGSRLLDGGGSFPVLTCSYDDFASFDDYARAMGALGARFVVVRNREIVGSVDLETGQLGEAFADRAYSPRARDYTGEPGLASIAKEVRRRFGRDSVVMMLVPREVDAGLYGGLANALSRRGDRHDDYREIRGRYQRGPDGGVQLRVDTAVRLDGASVEIGLLFDLSDIAGSPAPRGPAA